MKKISKLMLTKSAEDLSETEMKNVIGGSSTQPCPVKACTSTMADNNSECVVLVSGHCYYGTCKWVPVVMQPACLYTSK